MSWFTRTPPKHPQEIHVPRVRFLGPQDGPAEQIFKDRVAEFFKKDRSVHAAFLARADIGGAATVALCLKTQFGPDRGMAEKVGTIFKTVFNAQVHLDIMFPNANQEAELTRVCKPFFVQVAPELKLQPSETELVGAWTAANGQVQADATCERIERLTAYHLRKVGVGSISGGWETLFQDPDDERFWERTYPQGEMHGGGPPRLA
jgi:hypothetical protein